MAELAARNAKTPATGRARKQRPPRSIAPLASTAVPASMRHALPPGGGEPLPADVAARMGERFGIDFRGVRVHSGTEAQRAAAEHGAKAYAIGSHIVFAEGRFDPYSAAGERLLAHELAHVVQQSRGGSLAPVDAQAPHENAAHEAAESAVVGDAPVSVTGATAVGMARDDDEKKKPKQLPPGPDAPKQLPPGPVTVDQVMKDEKASKRFHEVAAGTAGKVKDITNVQGEIFEEVMSQEVGRRIRHGSALQELLPDNVDANKLRFVSSDSDPSKLKRGEAMYVRGDRIKGLVDGKAVKLTDGMILVHDGKGLRVATAFESKSGERRASDLHRTEGGKEPPSKADRAEQEAVRKETPKAAKVIESEMGGQVRKSVERLSPDDDGREHTVILVDGKPLKVRASPKGTLYLGVVPKDVNIAAATKQLKDNEGINFRALNLQSTEGEIKAAASQVAAKAQEGKPWAMPGPKSQADGTATGAKKLKAAKPKATKPPQPTKPPKVAKPKKPAAPKKATPKKTTPKKTAPPKQAAPDKVTIAVKRADAPPAKDSPKKTDASKPQQPELPKKPAMPQKPSAALPHESGEGETSAPKKAAPKLPPMPEAEHDAPAASLPKNGKPVQLRGGGKPPRRSPIPSQEDDFGNEGHGAGAGAAVAGLIEAIAIPIINHYLQEHYKEHFEEQARKLLADSLEKERPRFEAEIRRYQREIESAQADGRTVSLHVVLNLHWQEMRQVNSPISVGTGLARVEVLEVQVVHEGQSPKPYVEPELHGAGDWLAWLFRGSVRDAAGTSSTQDTVDIQLEGTNAEGRRIREIDEALKNLAPESDEAKTLTAERAKLYETYGEVVRQRQALKDAEAARAQAEKEKRDKSHQAQVIANDKLKAEQAKKNQKEQALKMLLPEPPAPVGFGTAPKAPSQGPMLGPFDVGGDASPEQRADLIASQYERKRNAWIAYARKVQAAYDAGTLTDLQRAGFRAARDRWINDARVVAKGLRDLKQAKDASRVDAIVSWIDSADGQNALMVGF